MFLKSAVTNFFPLTAVKFGGGSQKGRRMREGAALEIGQCRLSESRTFIYFDRDVFD